MGGFDQPAWGNFLHRSIQLLWRKTHDWTWRPDIWKILRALFGNSAVWGFSAPPQLSPVDPQTRRGVQAQHFIPVLYSVNEGAVVKHKKRINALLEEKLKKYYFWCRFEEIFVN